MEVSNEQDWRIYKGIGKPHSKSVIFPDPPPWRKFTDNSDEERLLARGAVFQVSEPEVDLVNAALILNVLYSSLGSQGAENRLLPTPLHTNSNLDLY